MRNPSKGTAACWDCKFYKVIDGYGNGTPIRTCNADKKVQTVVMTMPMKCKDKVKSK
jgi:hypothetical protein